MGLTTTSEMVLQLVERKDLEGEHLSNFPVFSSKGTLEIKLKCFVGMDVLQRQRIGFSYLLHRPSEDACRDKLINLREVKELLLRDKGNCFELFRHIASFYKRPRKEV